MTKRRRPGLTYGQADTLRHIARCPGCGEWVVIIHGNPHPKCTPDDDDDPQPDDERRR